MSGGNSHVAAIKVALGSSEAIAHGIGKHREAQKPMCVCLQTDNCLLLLLLSLSAKYLLFPFAQIPNEKNYFYELKKT